MCVRMCACAHVHVCACECEYSLVCTGQRSYAMASTCAVACVCARVLTGSTVVSHLFAGSGIDCGLEMSRGLEAGRGCSIPWHYSGRIWALFLTVRTHELCHGDLAAHPLVSAEVVGDGFEAP